MATSTQCAACKYFRRKCSKDCILSPHFPSKDPQRFKCVHRIYGASNIAKMLQQLPETQRTDAVNSLYYEAQCRTEDPVYGCVRMISFLHQQIKSVEIELAKARVQIAIVRAQESQVGEDKEHQEQDILDYFSFTAT